MGDGRGSMYKVMIVDDEVLVRVGLKSTIDWEAIGFSIVAEASNGEKGYEQYRRHTPDVIITDIKMPHKDGMWLIKKIRETDKWVKILILTCYDEFGYVREALKLGADDYILKSEIEDEELIQSMKQLKEKLELIPDKDKELRVLQKHFESNVAGLKAKWLEDLLKENTFNEKIVENEHLKIQFPMGQCEFAFITFIREDKKDLNEGAEEDNNTIDEAIMNLIYDICNNEKLHALIRKEEEKFQVLLGKDMLNQSNIEWIMTYVQEKVMHYFNRSLSSIGSPVFSRIGELKEITKMIKIKEEDLFYTQGSQMLFIEGPEGNKTINTLSKNVFNLDRDFKKLIVKSIDEENPEECKVTLGEVSLLFEQYHMNPLEVKLFYSNLVNSLFEKYGQCFMECEYIEDYHYYYHKIIHLNKMQELISLIHLFIEDVIRSIKEYRINNSKYVMKKAIEYIHANYDKKISLEDIASYINLSKHYVSYLFKKEAGTNISHYINEVRIEKAKEIIVQREYKIKEIYERVGFSDQQYFSKTFKKSTGMTVTQYRESISVKQ